jgi:putative salt-induced outer membrane protein
MKKLSFVLFLLFASILANAQTPDEIFNKFYNATGGKNLWDSVKTYKINQSFKANAPTDYDMELNVSLENKSISKRKTIMQKDFFYVMNGSEAWLKIPLGSNDKKVKYDVKDLGDKDKKALQDESKDYPIAFLNYAAKGYKASYVGLEDKNQRVLLEGNGTKYDLYFDNETGLLVKSVETSPSETITYEHKNYAKSKFGVSYPSESIYMSSKDKKKINVSTQMSLNDTLEPMLFAR